MELHCLLNPYAPFVPGVSRHSTRMFFGFDLACKAFFPFKLGDMAEI
jgi:hypothetical protein